MSKDSARILADYRISDFSIVTTDLIFELSPMATRVSNTMKIKRQVQGASTLTLDGEQLALISVQLNGQAIDSTQYQVTDEHLVINVEQDEFILTVVTEINPEANTALEGLYKSGGAFCTQCEAEGFRRISYYLDRPDVLSVFTVKIIADKASYPYLLANGNKTESGELENGKHFAIWHDPHPKPCYLFALVAGDFDLLEDSFTTSEGRNVALEIFVDKGNLSKASHAMESLKKSMAWDEEVFGLAYDLDVYMIVAVDFFNMGAMENKGLNVFNSKYVLADKESATDTDYFNIEAVIAHEYFHNWTGNRVTCRDWFQLSLKEGLTVFRDQQFSADMHSAGVNRIKNVRLVRSAQFAEDASPMAHPIRPEKVLEMNNFYTMTVYEKGAEVIRMIHTLLGQEKFRSGMDLYFQRFDGMAVTCDDFVDAMADSSGVDLTLFKNWYSQSGTPVVTISEQFDSNTKKLTLTISQHHPKTADQQEKKNLHIPIQLELINQDKAEMHLLELTDTEQSFVLDDVNEDFIIAPLANFSAPVRVKYQQSEESLCKIMSQASDPFNKWDASQELFSKAIDSLMLDSEYRITPTFIENLKALFTTTEDPALLSQQLTIPNLEELQGNYQKLNPIVMLDAIDSLSSQIGSALLELLEQKYISLSLINEKEISVGERELKNTCLAYLAKYASKQDNVVKQFNETSNMTDCLASLRCAADNSDDVFIDLMKQFEAKWQDTNTVMDKWFTLAASQKTDQIFEKLTELTEHPLFTLKNPNRARSLLGAFSRLNSRYFHCESGRGYKFLKDYIAKMNDINPQVASVLITPLIQFEQFDEVRQALMKTQLQELAQLPTLSNDLKEKLEASLK